MTETARGHNVSVQRERIALHVHGRQARPFHHRRLWERGTNYNESEKDGERKTESREWEKREETT